MYKYEADFETRFIIDIQKKNGKFFMLIWGLVQKVQSSHFYCIKIFVIRSYITKIFFVGTTDIKL